MTDLEERIHKIGSFALYVTSKKSQWILVKLRINISCVLRNC